MLMVRQHTVPCKRDDRDWCAPKSKRLPARPLTPTRVIFVQSDKFHYRSVEPVSRVVPIRPTWTTSFSSPNIGGPAKIGGGFACAFQGAKEKHNPGIEK